jgi:hypothetical protein
MDPLILAELKALGADARSISTAFGSFADRLDKLVSNLTPKEALPASPSDFKRYDGRLNDDGIRLMEAAFEAGRRVTDIARDFKITVSAASHRKRIWEAKRDFAD